MATGLDSGMEGINREVYAPGGKRTLTHQTEDSHYYYPYIYHPFKAQWLLYVPPSLTFNNYTFCPHSVFMCFVWI